MSIRIFNPKSWHSTLWVIRNRPGMYLGSKTLKGILHYVDGIFWAEHMYGIHYSKKLSDFDWSDFEIWVAKNKKTDPRGRSMFMALGQTKTEEEAFDLWFSWYDEYNATEAPWHGKENYENWKKNNEQDELHRYIDDGSDIDLDVFL